MTRTASLRGRFALTIGHCAGMVDAVALPLWVGILISGYQLNPQHAGLVVTLYLLGAAVASIVLAPLFERLNGPHVAALGFGVSAVTFAFATNVNTLWPLALLHAIGGVAAGAALSVTHGTIGRSDNPHRLFGVANSSLGLLSIAFMAGVPLAVATWGPQALFRVFGLVMVIGCVVAVLAFPQADAESAEAKALRLDRSRLPAPVWFAIVGVSAMALVLAMNSSFIERVGIHHGFSQGQVTLALVIMGVTAIFPPGLAALLQRRLNAGVVLVCGPIAQAVFVLGIVHNTAYWLYVVCVSLLLATMLFTHTFAFGLLANLDRSGRAVAATPAMLLVGGAMGPLIGGTAVKAAGYGGLAWVAVAIDIVAIVVFLLMYRVTSRTSEAVPA